MRRFSSHSIDENDLRERNVEEIAILDQVLLGPNSPNDVHAKSKDDDSLVKPLRKEKLREKLMPNIAPVVNVNTLKSDFELEVPHELMKKPESTKNVSTKKFNFEFNKQESLKDKKILELQLLVNSLKKENMDLRLYLNYFMQKDFKPE